ncbi:fatty acid-binding protein, brain-like [Argopecten irradians]|uniref:fatty acid-binding protein, brain-like n=1 Tax=Argopecten irradians TaxID=31199 RepID=UPI003717228F
MANEFIGTWMATKPASETDGFVKFSKAMNIKEEMLQQYGSVIFGVTYSNEGDKWTVESLVSGKSVKSTSFESGKEFESKGLDQKAYKTTITIDGCKITESTVPVDGSTKGTITTRLVKDGEMTATTVPNEHPDCSMTYIMKKQ